MLQCNLFIYNKYKLLTILSIFFLYELQNILLVDCRHLVKWALLLLSIEGYYNIYLIQIYSKLSFIEIHS